MPSAGMELLGAIVLFSCFLQSEGSTERQVTGQFIKAIRKDAGFEALPPNVTVSVGLTLTSINEANEEQGYIDIDGWIIMRWTDKKLKTMFEGITDGNISSISLPADTKLWKPDLILYNEHAVSSKMRDVPLVVFRGGAVTWISPRRIVANCRMPAVESDVHKCVLKFGSWTYDGFKVHLKTDADVFDMSSYVDNPRFEITNTTARVDVVYYPCCPEPFPLMYFNIAFKHMQSAGYRDSPRFFEFALVATATILLQCKHIF